MNSTTVREWLKLRALEEQLARQALEKRNELERIRSEWAELNASLEGVRRDEYGMRRQMERELQQADRALQALAFGPDPAKIEGETAHTERYIAGDKR